MHKEVLLPLQREEATEYVIYTQLAKRTKDKHNKKILETIAKEEQLHYHLLAEKTKQQIQPSKTVVWWYVFLARIFGLSFGLHLMAKRVHRSEKSCAEAVKLVKGITCIHKNKRQHRFKLLNKIIEERVTYAGSIVLGLNDALVEITGALAGFTFALQQNKLVALTGLIMGVAAALSMTASEYLSSKEEMQKRKNPYTSALYTGLAYLGTVILLVLPYFIFEQVFVSLGVMFVIALLIIFFYSFYMSTAKQQNLWQKFGRMAAISLIVALISFGIGLLVKIWLGVEI